MFISFDAFKNRVRSYTNSYFSDIVVGSEERFPKRIPLGRVMAAEYVSDPAMVLSAIDEWRNADTEFENVVVEWSDRKLCGIQVEVPVAASVLDVDTAFRFCLSDEVLTFRKTFERIVVLRERYSTSDEVLHKYAKRLSGFTATDFALLIDACDWFLKNDPHDMTPRQIPVAHLHSKWLDNKSRLISDIIGRDLDLRQRMHRVFFSYCDSTYLDAGGRRFDSYVIGDVCEIAYVPDIVLIVENKDCFECMSDFDGLICVYGEGYGAVALLDQVPFVRECKNVFYWGDIDTDGFAALGLARAKLGNVKSVLMDRATYDKYILYGVTTDKFGSSLATRAAAVVDSDFLTKSEIDMFEFLTSFECKIRRLEQEKIPFFELRDALSSAMR